VLNTVIVAVPQMLLAAGVSKLSSPSPHSFVLFPAQIITGPTVSTLAMVWLHTLVLPHGSVATQVRVATNVFPQPRLVTVLNIVIVAVPQLLLAIGVSKLSTPIPHSFVLFPAQEMTGPCVEIVAIV
jgi:hypothetical protein